MYTPISIKQLNRTVFIILVSLFLSSACQNQNTQPVLPENQPLSRFQTDSFAVFPFNKSLGFFDKGYAFSPFDDTKVWMTPESVEGFELNLKTGEAIPFSQRFGHDFFKKPLRFDGIYPDPFDKNLVWFLSFHGGVFQYHQNTGAGQFLEMAAPHRAILTAAFTAKNVWFGTSNGLWEFDRSSGAYRMIERSPDMLITKIIITPEGKLQVGKGYLYNPADDCWESGQVYEWQDPSQQYNRYTSRELPYDGEPYKRLTTGKYTWIVNSRYWFVQTPNETALRNLKPLSTKRIAHLNGDLRQLYLLYEDAFIVTNQAFALKHLNGDPTLHQRLAQLQQLTDSLNLFHQEPLAARSEKMKGVWQVFEGEKDSFILSRLAYFSPQIQLPSNEKALREWLKQPDLDTAIIRRAYQNLIDGLIHDGQWAAAIRLADEMPKSVLKAAYTSFKSPHGLDTLRQAVKRMKIIDASDAPADEKQWLKAKLWKEASLNSGFFHSDGCAPPNLGLAHTQFQKLLKQYPNSLRADDAEFELLTFDSFMEGDCYPELIESLKSFLKKYPNTNCRAEVLCAMAYASCPDKSSLRKALKYLEEARQLKPELFQEKPEGNFYLDLKQQLTEMLGRASLVFEIELKQDTFQRNAPVELTFTLINSNNSPYNLNSLFKTDIPNFSIEVIQESGSSGCSYPSPFIEQIGFKYPTYPDGYEDRMLAAGKMYRESWNITQIARNHRRNMIGKYVFDQAGVYQITAYFGEKQAESIRLVVE